MSVGQYSFDTQLQDGTGSYGKHEQVPPQGKFVKRIEEIKYIKEVSVTEEYYEDGALRFSHPSDIQRYEAAPTTRSVTIAECSNEAFTAGEMRWKEQQAKSTRTPSQETEEDQFKEAGNFPVDMSLVSEDEEESEKVSEQKQRSEEPTPEETFSQGKYPNDNYHPAQIIGDDAKSVEADEVFCEKFGNGTSTDKSAGSKHVLEEGTVVFGEWTDGNYYSGKITSFSLETKQYSVGFLDYLSATLPIDQVILADEMVKPDAIVYVKTKNGCENGTIVSVTGSDENTEAVVKFGGSRQDTIHISELVFDKKEVKRVQSGKPVMKDTDSGSLTEIQQRLRQSTLLSTVFPPKPEKTLATVQRKPEPKSARKTHSAKKQKVVEDMVIDADQTEKDHSESRKSTESDRTRTHQVGTTAFKHKEEVFGKWDDGRWYAAWVTGTRQSKFQVLWCDTTNGQKNTLSADEIIKAADILEEGTRVMVEGKVYYSEVTFDKRMEKGPHLVKNKKKQIIEKRFEEMMIQDDEVIRWRNKQVPKTPITSADGTLMDTETPSMAAGASEPTLSAEPTSSVKATSPTASVEKSEKRTRSLSTEEETGSPTAKRTASSPLAESPQRETQGPPFAQCSFIITSGGAGKDPTFDRNYIVSKIGELGGNVLNTFDGLINVAGKRFLISPGPCRTAKFLQCLAANFPCVSHKWIVEVADKNQWVEYEQHRLQTGESAEGQIIEWAPREMLLDSMRIALYGGSSFRSIWVPALRTAKAIPTVLEEQDADSNMKRFDVVVVDDRAPTELITSCQMDGVPVTTEEWIIQTLIHGTMMDFGNWPYSEAAEDA